MRGRREHSANEVWKLNRQISRVTAGTRLRIQAGSPFLLHWTTDERLHYTHTQSTATNLDIDFVDVPVPREAHVLRFTFLWLNENRWEGRDYEIGVHAWAATREALA